MNIRAYAYANGVIEFTSGCVPAGALIIAHGPMEVVRPTVQALARRGYYSESFLVPGCPEAADDIEAALKAFQTFFDRVQVALGKHALGARS